MTVTKSPPNEAPGVENRRRHPRYLRRLGLEYHIGQEWAFGCTLNVSPGGVSMSTGHLLRVGEAIEGRVRLPGGEVVSFMGYVRWVSTRMVGDVPMHEAGIQFAVMPEAPFYRMLYDMASSELTDGRAATGR